MAGASTGFSTIRDRGRRRLRSPGTGPGRSL